MADVSQPTAPRNDAVEARNITRQYVKGTFTALDDITVMLHENEIISFIGPSGCGKTTMLRLIAGLELPTRGRLSTFGEPIRGPGPDRGMIFQAYTSFPWLSAKKNIEPFGARDAQVRWEMQEMMIEVIEREKKTVITVTHDIEEAIYLSDRIIFFTRQPGRIKANIPLEFKNGRRFPRKEELFEQPGYNDMERRLFAMMREESTGTTA